MVKAEGTAPVSVWKSVPYYHEGPQGSSEPGSSRTASKSGESSESSSRKRTSKKKPPPTGIWPCKINGCNKQFAREADLKRHQRTTKTHSMPSLFVLYSLFHLCAIRRIQNADCACSSACPQCDASFTRVNWFLCCNPLNLALIQS